MQRKNLLNIGLVLGGMSFGAALLAIITRAHYLMIIACSAIIVTAINGAISYAFARISTDKIFAVISSVLVTELIIWAPILLPTEHYNFETIKLGDELVWLAVFPLTGLTAPFVLLMSVGFVGLARSRTKGN
jgi:hypothetical protein